MATLGKLKHAQAVTPNDTLGLRHPSMYLSFMGVSGAVGVATVYVDTIGGESNVGITLPAGMYPICATKVYNTNTTATDIVAYWED